MRNAAFFELFFHARGEICNVGPLRGMKHGFSEDFTRIHRFSVKKMAIPGLPDPPLSKKRSCIAYITAGVEKKFKESRVAH